MDYSSTEFGVDSSSCFPFRARTYRQTDRPVLASFVMYTFQAMAAAAFFAHKKLGRVPQNQDWHMQPRCLQHSVTPIFSISTGAFLRLWS